MPELSEVEVVRLGLQKIFQDQPTLQKIELMRPDLRFPIPLKKLNSLVGERILSVERRAKYLLLKTAKGDLLSHLGMTGTWRIAPLGDERDHDHVYLHFSDSLRLAYRDPRRFGILDFVPFAQQPRQFKHLGPEPLEIQFSSQYLWSLLRRKQTPIKVAIMDQRVVVGVGNIYACEALFAARIRPQKQASLLTQRQAEQLVHEIKKILTRAIGEGGSSISDFKATNGSSGYFQTTFKVYGRQGEPCRNCGHPLRAQVLGGRNSFWCPRCQK